MDASTLYMTHRNSYVPMLTFLLALGAAGCSEESNFNSAPVIDKLDLPDTAVKEGDNYSLTGFVTYHDDDEVKKMNIYTPAGAKDPALTIPIPGGDGAENAEIKLIFKGTPGTSIDYELSLIDSRSLEGARSKRTVKIP